MSPVVSTALHVIIMEVKLCCNHADVIKLQLDLHETDPGFGLFSRWTLMCPTALRITANISTYKAHAQFITYFCPFPLNQSGYQWKLRFLPHRTASPHQHTDHWWLCESLNETLWFDTVNRVSSHPSGSLGPCLVKQIGPVEKSDTSPTC